MTSTRSMSSGAPDASQRVGPLPVAAEPVVLGGRPLPVVGTARIYVCGITPYDVTHLGHASTFVWADVLAAVVESTGALPQLSRNITDVDDVLIDAARAKGRHYDEFALVQEAVFERSMQALRVATPHTQPRARHYIDAAQQLAAALLAVDAAYERGGTVWFRGGEIWREAGLERDQALALSAAYGDRPDDEGKDDPFDVAVWRPSGDGDPAWPSPWGWGRPGWHAECAAMALTVQGASIDVLVGGADLAFPHHAYQAAMVQAASAVSPFARSILHVGEVQLSGEKMAKSTGNLVLVDDLLTDTTPAALRLLLLDRPYASAWSFERDDLPLMEARLEQLYAAAGKPATSTSSVDEVLRLLRTDLDVPAALHVAESSGGEAARTALRLLRLG